MTESLTFKGVWFIPEQPDNRLTGTLNFDPQKGIELELIGTLVESGSSKNIHEPNIILGITTDGKEITLYRCYESSRSMNLPGMPTCMYVGIFLLEGSHFAKSTDLLFHRVRGRLHNLETWTSRFGFKTVESDRATKTTRVEYTLPEPIEFDIRSTTKGKLNFTASVPYSTYSNSATIEQKVEIIIEHDNGLLLDDAIQDFFHFQNFITLGTFEASHALSIEVTSQTLTEEWPEGKHYPVPVNVYFQHSIKIGPSRNRILWEFLFHYHDIEANFQSIIAQWFEHKESLGPVIALLLDTFYKRGSFTENVFLNIVQGLETFHRRFRKNEVRSHVDHKVMVAEILSAVPETHKSWLQERLNFSNEPTLHKRLDELVDELSNETLKKIITEKESFIRDVKNSRNYYTHYDKSTEKKAKKGSELFTLTEKLKVVLVCAVLSQTGFTAEEIEALFSRNEFKFFNHILASDKVATET